MNEQGAMHNDKRQSLRGLDWINFFMADVNTGIGPFLAIYLTATGHWNPADVGIAVSAQSIASVLAQAPAGWLVDNSKNKKWLIIIGASIVAAGCICIVLAPSLPWQVANQVLIGLTAALFPPTIAAMALGIVGKPELSRRAGRNEGFNHAGNVVRVSRRWHRGSARSTVDLLCFRFLRQRNDPFSLDDSK